MHNHILSVCDCVQTLEREVGGWQEQPVRVMDINSDKYHRPTSNRSTPEKHCFTPAVCDESAELLSQLNEASQLNAALQRGLDVCSNISAGWNNVEHPHSAAAAAAASNHPFARQLDDLKHLYCQVGWAQSVNWEK